jgi:16S rRNA (adenine1518-N6/adenine1519-N6)-dimethyltransferase
LTTLDLCRPETVRAVARRFRVLPQHRLGQNFLISKEVRDAIVGGVDVKIPALEIGCGLGARSQGLLEAGVELTGMEVDPNCVAALRLLQAGHPSFRVIQKDALLVGANELGLPAPYQVVANLPYQITGALLPRLLEWRPQPSRCRLLVQREVARRLTAELGDWSLATLTLRLVATVTLEFDVDPASFWPSPRVWSSLIELRPRPGARPELLPPLIGLARPIFQMRRKQVHHGLTRALGGDANRAAAALAAAGIEPTRRPGSLGLEEWERLLQELGPLQPG